MKIIIYKKRETIIVSFGEEDVKKLIRMITFYLYT